MRALVLNAGSSTLKWTLLDGGTRAVLDGGTEEWHAEDLAACAERVRTVIARCGSVDAVGHRVVNGGTKFVAPVELDVAARGELAALADLDPMHMRPALAGVDAVAAALPAVRQFAAFDTSFHATLPAAAAAYALPREWTEKYALRRFGFHGLSVEYSLGRARELLGETPARMIVCHLGSGCSVTAVAAGKSIDTSMGFTPLEGVVMSTRSGSLDPGILLSLMSRVPADELTDALWHRSGLLGISGVSGDLRQVMATRAQSPRARLAYDAFIWSVRRAVGAMAGVLGGADALVFTGGIGENAGEVRQAVAPALPGLALDATANGASPDDRLISPARSPAALVVHAREDLVILDGILSFHR
jgi:acetate kinase